MFGHCKYQIELTKELLFHVHMDVELRWDIDSRCQWFLQDENIVY
jgi:hypothetical protein